MGLDNTQGWRDRTSRGTAGSRPGWDPWAPDAGMPGEGWGFQDGDGEGGFSPALPPSPVPSSGLGLADPLWLPATTPPCPSPAAEPCKAEGCYQGHAEVCRAA